MARINISTYYYAVNFELLFTTVSQNIANNTSQVRVLGRLIGTGNGEYDNTTTTGSVTFNGANYNFNVTPYSFPDGSSVNRVLFDQTFTVAHGSDGKKTVSGSMSWNHGSPVFKSAYVQETVTLATIPRTSQPSLNVSTQALGSAITIYTNRASSSFTHTISYKFGSQTGTIGTGVGSSTSWTLPAGLASAIPNSTSGVGTITCKTYNGDTLIGSKSVSFTATVPNNSTYRPTATISNIVEGASIPSGITVFVQNYSKAKVTSTGTGKYSATIKTYSVSVANIGTYTGSEITSGFLLHSGSVRITLTVTDSRGLKGSTYQDITVVAYSPPQIPTFKASRSESTPANISVNYNASISSINSQNNKYFRIRSKASDGSWVVKTDSTQNYTFSGTETIVSNSDKSYTIELYVEDSFTSTTQTVQVGTAFTLIDFNASGRGMAIGKVSETNAFEIGMTAFDKNGAEIIGFSRGRLPAGSNLHETPEGFYQLVGEYIMGTGSSMSGILIVLDPNPNSDSAGKTMIFISSSGGMWIKTYWGGWSVWRHYDYVL